MELLRQEGELNAICNFLNYTEYSQLRYIKNYATLIYLLMLMLFAVSFRD